MDFRRLCPEEDSQELTRHCAPTRPASDAFREPLLLGFGFAEGVRVGLGVSQVLAAFCTTLAAMYGTLAPP
jgi:hypothetical protein